MSNISLCSYCFLILTLPLHLILSLKIIYIVIGTKNGTASLKKSLAGSHKVRQTLAMWSSNLTQDVDTREMKFIFI